MALVYLGLGTNLGNKQLNLNQAIEALKGVGEVKCQSSFLSSKPWGFESENEFVNAVIVIETKLQPMELLTKAQEIETILGRKAKSEKNYSDRIIDIDILFYDELILDAPELKIPHPLIAERDFVVLPLVEIAPDLYHPLLKRTMVELRNELTNKE